MKSRISLLLLFSFIGITTLKSQSLLNTYWKGYYGSTPTYFKFGVDTLYNSNGSSGPYSKLSTYSVSGNIFLIHDITPFACNQDTGKYTFTIQNDILQFTSVKDNCEARKTALVSIPWTKLFTGIFDLSAIVVLDVFPNPFATELKLQTEMILNDAALTLYNSLGQAVRQIKNIYGRSASLTRGELVAGQYLMVLTQGNERLATRKIVIADTN